MILWVIFALISLLLVVALMRGGFAGLLRLLLSVSFLGGLVFLLAIAEMDLVAAGVVVTVLVGIAGIVVRLLRRIRG